MSLPTDESVLRSVGRSLAPTGLSVRGYLNLTAEDRASTDATSAILIGNAGGVFWPIFERWRTAQRPDLPNPLDTWSRETIGAVAERVGARPVYPSDKPYLPFQQWAMQAEGLRPSPLGILMHPEFGVWHAYRGALLFDRALDLPDPPKPIHVCDLCDGKPCRKSCPVNAHLGDGFAYHDCLEHVRGSTGGECRTGGCMDRNACPYGLKYRYPKEMQAFIMRAFARETV